MFAKWTTLSFLENANSIWVYAEKLGMGIEPHTQWRHHPQNPLFLKKV
jgi:hypothetical protein